MNNYISFLGWLKNELKICSGINDVYYETIPKSENEVFPIISFNNTNTEILDEQTNLYTIDINVWDNNFEDVLALEQLTQNIVNCFNRYRCLETFNNTTFFVFVLDINQINAYTETDNLRRRIITINFNIQFKAV